MVLLMKKLFFITLLSTLVLCVRAQSQYVLKGDIATGGNDVVLLSDGDYILAGDEIISCLTSWGSVLWSLQVDSLPVKIREVMEVQPGLIVIASYDGVSDYTVVFELDDQHNVLWQKQYACYTETAQMTSDSSIILKTLAHEIVKLKRNGDLAWKRTVGSGSFFYETSSGDYIMGSWSHAYRTDTSGNTVWHKAFDNVTRIESVTETPGGLIFSGVYINVFSGGPGHHLTVLKTDHDGNTLLQNTYATGQWIICHQQQTFVGENYAHMMVMRRYTNEPANPNNNAVYYNLIKVDSSGSVAWFTNYPLNGAATKAAFIPGEGFLYFERESTFSIFGYLHKLDLQGEDPCGVNTYAPWSVNPLLISDDTMYAATLGVSALSAVNNGAVAVSSASVNFEMMCFTGMNETSSALRVKLFPNPCAASVVTIDAGNSAGGLIMVYSADGTLVRQVNAPQFPYSMPVHDLAPGMYVVETRAGEIVRRERLIIR
jgi:hypothetical protein